MTCRAWHEFISVSSELFVIILHQHNMHCTVRCFCIIGSVFMVQTWLDGCLAAWLRPSHSNEHHLEPVSVGYEHRDQLGASCACAAACGKNPVLVPDIQSATVKGTCALPMCWRSNFSHMSAFVGRGIHRACTGLNHCGCPGFSSAL